jgi:hypothetical protein
MMMSRIEFCGGELGKSGATKKDKKAAMTEEDKSLSTDTTQTTLSDFLNKVLAQIATIVFMAAFLVAIVADLRYLGLV